MDTYFWYEFAFSTHGTSASTSLGQLSEFQIWIMHGIPAFASRGNNRHVSFYLHNAGNA
jgi:hypothetical protein